MVTITNKVGGELLDFPTDTPEQILLAYRQAKEFEDMGKRLKAKLKPQIASILDENGVSPEYDGYVLRSYESQRRNYNRMALYDAFGDEDTVNNFMEVSKGKVDAYRKENDLTAEQIAILEAGLEPNGKVVQSVRLEKLTQ